MKKWFYRLLIKNERGASLVEFALVVPILLALLLGIIEFGWLFNGWITITGSAREGARMAAVGKEYEDIQEAIERHTSTFYSVSFDDDYGSEEVTISVTGDIRPLVGFFVGGSDRLVTLNAEATMRLE